MCDVAGAALTLRRYNGQNRCEADVYSPHMRSLDLNIACVLLCACAACATDEVPSNSTGDSTTGESGSASASASTGSQAVATTGAVDDETGEGGSDGPPPGPICGDNTINGDEICDGTDFAGTTCESLGFEQGELACTGNCGGFDLTGCGFFVCGNGKAQGEEDCDGTVGNATCASEGFDNGTLFCTAQCEYDVSMCGTCGNKSIEEAEDCDTAADLNATCGSLGFMTGQLQCGKDCLYDSSGCSSCGNDLQEAAEDCDGLDIPGKTCLGEGFDSGTLACQDNCQFDFSACGTCGNNLRDGDELCDQNDFGASNCATEGFDSGALTCNAACDTITTDSCGTCGNGIIDGAEGCDGVPQPGTTCAALGLGGGELACNAGCQHDISGCDVQVLPNLLLCGTSTRDVSVFIPPLVNLTVVMSCVPDANTQAILVTRNGVNLFDGPTLQAYVQAGGNVLTETFSSDEVYNAVFGTNIIEAAPLIGSCLDIFPSVVQFTPLDPFWGANVFTPILLNETGCGKEVTDYPLLTPLSGWSIDEVAIGYRDAMLGRVWVTEFDWQDNQVGDFDYSAEMMGAMIVYPAQL